MRRWSFAALAAAAVLAALPAKNPDVFDRGGWDRNGPASAASTGPSLDRLTLAAPKGETVVARRGGGWDANGPLSSGSTGPVLDGLSTSLK